MKSHSKDDNIFLISLQIVRGSQDYYYPYLNGQDSISHCLVPKNSPPGTLVFTGGMNGCSMQVDDLGTHLDFMHCNNGCGQKNVNTLCRINYNDYAGKNDTNSASFGKPLGKTFTELSQDLSKKLKVGPNYFACYAYYPIAIKDDYGWKVYFSCVLWDDKYNHYKLLGARYRELYRIASFE